MKDSDINTVQARPGSTIHKILKPTPPRHEPTEQEAMESFQEARSQSRDALMLDIKLANGRIVSLPYSALSVSDYLPDGTLLLRFGRYKVTAEGRNMLRVRELITEHRARFIQEGVDIERGTKDKDAVHFERIEVTEEEEL